MGRTFYAYFKFSFVSDHPHACGENLASGSASDSYDGPSPRVWGERTTGKSRFSLQRTIPTRVGRTQSKGRPHKGRPDHPHACGENKTMSDGLALTSGPSPRVWGERCRTRRPLVGFRTIPTRVGRTTSRQPIQHRDADHPHACGENRVPTCVVADSRGPSPRVWGELIKALS